MERFDIGGSEWGLQHRKDGLGKFTWADTAQWYKLRYNMTLWAVLILGLLCVGLVLYIDLHQHDPQPVQQAAVSAEEYQQAIQLAERKEVEKATLRKQLADEHARRLLGDKMLQTSNANNAKLVKQLEALQVSVPTQPIILKELYKEASTPQGFRQAVDRAFGNGMGARIKVVNE